MNRHAIAQAHATHNHVLRLTAAWAEFDDALAEERRCLKEKLDDPRNQIAHRLWLRSCGVFAIARMKLEDVIAEFELSAALAKELAS